MEIRHRAVFFRGAIVGLVLVIIKLVVVLPINIADILYGIALLVTLAITFAELIGWSLTVLQSRSLDFILGFLFPLDAYAILILFGVPLPN